MEKIEIVKGIEGIVGQDRVLTDEQSVLEAAKDYIGFRVFQRADGKNFAPRAACVVKAKSTEEISKVMKFLNDNKIDVVPRTGGSSVTQGVEPVNGGVILDGSLMNKIIEVNENNMTVTALCGTPLEYLEDYLNERGYTTGHLPQSLPMAHIGGLLATRSIGQFSTLYGGIEDLTIGLEAVMADGEVVRIKNVPRRSCGPDLKHLFIGNEGLLGFITEATIKIFKYRPEERWMRAYGIKDMQEGLKMLHNIMADGYKPAVVRLHDAAEVMMVLGLQGVVPAEHGIMLFLCEGPNEIAQVTGKAIARYAEQYNAVDLGDKPVLSWLKTRNDVCKTMDDGKYHEMDCIADTCEISANWDSIGKIYEGVTTRLSDENDSLAYVGGHSSHSYMQGTNIYFTFAFMEENGSEAAQADYMNVIRVIMEETLKNGGSIAHHHGSGKYRTEWMPEEHGSSYPLMYKLKDALDPNHILNKGVLLVDKK